MPSKPASNSSRRSTPRKTAAPRSRRSSSKGDSLVKGEELNQLIGEGKALAEQLVGRPRFAALAGLAPTFLTIAGRYVRREPVKSAGIAVLAGGVYLIARALMHGGSSGGAAGTATA
ncbi:MAG: hypothetical protein K0Q76_3490 [Panacagrimonas sp.]|nr:hypothetical protein [Panacagrimonas sp.]MCC2658382.1 hypothetical protein [Panacagrimonas sp.]